ncbi:hypothetical protein QEZ44_21960 [Bacillus cereus]|nr:hypothetical protein [Bacillus cereus]
MQIKFNTNGKKIEFHAEVNKPKFKLKQKHWLMLLWGGEITTMISRIFF